MPYQTGTMLPLVESAAAVHRGGFGVLRLGYLPSVPTPHVSEDEVRKSITFIDLTVTEQACAQLIELLTHLSQQLAKSRRGRTKLSLAPMCDAKGDRARDGINGASKFNPCAVTCCFHNPTIVGGKSRDRSFQSCGL